MANKHLDTTRLAGIGVQVIFNVGLGPATYSRAPQLTPARLLAHFSTAFRECLLPGYRGEVQVAVLADDEDTLVVAGVLNADVNSTTLLWDAVESAGQDAISIWYPLQGSGLLFGPHSAEWGHFDATLFKVPTWLTKPSQELQ